MLLACSAARLGYNNGEFISYWWLNGYIDVESEQKPRIRQQIGELFAWHRKTQLPGYAQLLARAQKRVEAPVTEAELLADYADAKKRLLLIVDHALPDMAELALSLQPHQIAAIEKKFASVNNTYRKDYLRGDLEQRQTYRYKKALKQAEDWFGEFSNEQERQLRAASDSRPLNNELVMAGRLRAQKAVITLLKRIQAERPSPEATRLMMKEAVAAWLDRFGNAEHKAFYDSYASANARMVAQIVNMSTPAQKAHFVKTTQQWIDDFEVLSR